MRVSAPTSRARLSLRIAAFDAIWIAAAPFLALALRDDSLLRHQSSEVCQYALITIACALPAAIAFRLGDGLSRDFAFVDAWAVLGAAGVASSMSATVAFTFNRLESVPRSTPLIYAMVLAAGWVGGRAVARANASRRMTKMLAPAPAHARARRVVVVGIDCFSTLAIKLVQRQVPRTVEFVAALDPRRRLYDRTINGVRVVGAPADLGSVVREYAEHGIDVDEVWVSDPLIAEAGEMRKALSDACGVLGVKWSSVSEALNLAPATLQHAAENSGPAGVIASPIVATAPDYFRLRRPLDVALAALCVAALAPLAAIVASIVAVDLGAPVIFWQQRIGRNGRPFLLYKFRTIRAPFDSAGLVIAEERRLSRIGRVVRKSRLDEFPQLWNVLRGEMALIGPRPLLPVDQPGDPRMRLAVCPGITGWAQVNGGTALSADEKDALDSWYISHASLAVDLQVIWRTLIRFGRGEQRDAAAIERAVAWRRGGDADESFVVGHRKPMLRRSGKPLDQLGGAS